MATTYTVQTGDTLFQIARRFGSTVERIAQANNIANPNNINVGQVLVIPDAAGAPPTGPVTTTPPADGAGAAAAPNRRTRRVGGLLYTIFTDRAEYGRGEEARITLIKTNATGSPITLRYRTGQRFDFVARRTVDGREVWRWSRGRSFIQAIAEVTLRPGESQIFRARWDQIDNLGRPVEPGTYTIEGINVAEGFATVGVSTTIRIRTVAPTPTPRPTPTPAPAPCPDVNIVRNPGFEDWPNPAAPPAFWTGSNLFRSTRPRTGRYAAGLGASPGTRAVLSQRVNIEAGRIYELSWWAIEDVVPGGIDRFTLLVEIFYFDRAGNFVGRTEPRYSQENIPEQRYQRYSFSTGRVPAAARIAEVRFTLEPVTANNNRVLIDDVELRCRF